jgi:hypothetical protein
MPSKLNHGLWIGCMPRRITTQSGGTAFLTVRCLDSDGTVASSYSRMYCRCMWLLLVKLQLIDVDIFYIIVTVINGVLTLISTIKFYVDLVKVCFLPCEL